MPSICSFFRIQDIDLFSLHDVGEVAFEFLLCGSLLNEFSALSYGDEACLLRNYDGYGIALLGDT